MVSRKSLVAGLLFLVLAVTTASGAFASVRPLDEIYSNLRPIGSTYGQSTLLDNDNTQHALIIRVARVLNVALSLLGIIFLVLTIYAGARWMTARGNEDLVEQAQLTLRNALIGLIVILSSYALTNYLITKLLEGTVGL